MLRKGFTHKRPSIGRTTFEASKIPRNDNTPVTVVPCKPHSKPVVSEPTEITLPPACIRKLTEEVASLHQKLDLIIADLYCDCTDTEDQSQPEDIDSFEQIPPKPTLSRSTSKAWPAHITTRTSTDAMSGRRLTDAPSSPRASTQAQVPTILHNGRYYFPACSRCLYDGFVYCLC